MVRFWPNLMVRFWPNFGTGHLGPEPNHQFVKPPKKQKQPSTPVFWLAKKTTSKGQNPTIKMPKIGPEPNLTAHMCAYIYIYML